MKRASIIVPTYNRSAALRNTLEAIALQPAELIEQVFICDDGSSDDTAAVAAHFARCLPLTYLFQEDLGFRAGAARNLGIEHAQTDLLVFFDDDCIPLRGCIEQHVALHARTARAIGIGRIAHVPGVTHAHLAAQTDLAQLPADERAPLAIEHIATHPAPWLLMWSCHFSVNRAELALCFDERLQGWGAEDNDVGLQLQHQGARFHYLEQAVVMHQDEARPRSPFLQEQLGLQPDYSSFLRNAALLLDKYAHDPDAAAWLCRLVRWAAARPNDGEWITQLV